MNTRDLVDADLKAGLKIGLCIGATVLMVVLQWREPRPSADSSGPALPPSTQPQSSVDFGSEVASTEARRLARWVVRTGDHGGRSFALVDKPLARIFVFEADGRLAGAAPVLLGSALGDDTVPGVASKPPKQLRPEERTTPAGRFVSRAGRNAEREEVIWVDYDAAVSMHRVRLTDPGERRQERLASPTVADNRISAGCINIPVEFFEKVLWPRFGSGRQGVIYVLPETRPLAAVLRRSVP